MVDATKAGAKKSKAVTARAETRKPLPLGPGEHKNARVVFAPGSWRGERHRDRQRAKEQAARDRLRKRRVAMEKAQRTLDVARERHERRVAKVRAQIDVLENKLRVDDERWKKESSRLEATLKRARIGGTR
ncbi:hypothetical protein [Bradyrhizobium elkanii]|uniref:hypothetical protein n=2 Tax=Bradyrhizobium elkanii TaxID=29448 RepID=UPI001AE5CDE1|nr:hypothetical protein [Bradyrhizobium elkanii]MBP2433969.1 hypothetical protein [Bradyrhizobium elkanii]WLA89071.1 hypothetical protein QNJ96_28850 [Bradyrhizobium elkanii]